MSSASPLPAMHPSSASASSPATASASASPATASALSATASASFDASLSALPATSLFAATSSRHAAPSAACSSTSLGLIAKCGRNSGVGLHGMPKDVMSSGLQKTGVRRGDVRVGSWYLFEWLHFGRWMEQEPTRCKSLLTNLENRLTQIIPYEDVLAFAQPALILAVARMAGEWRTRGRRLADGRFLLQAFEWLARARRSRVASDLRAFYTHAIHVHKLHAAPKAVDPAELPRLRCARDGDDPHATLLVASVMYYVRAESLDCMFFVFELLRLFETGKHADDRHAAQHMGCGTADYMLWSELSLAFESLNSTGRNFCAHSLALYRSNRTRPDRFLYLVHTLLLFFYRRNADISYDSKPYGLEAVLSASEFKARMQAHAEGPLHVAEDWVLDVHTAAGRSAGKRSSDFANNGSCVPDEDPQYLFLNMRAAYLHGKHADEARGTAKRPAPSESSEQRKKQRVLVAEVEARVEARVLVLDAGAAALSERLYAQAPKRIGGVPVAWAILAQLPCGRKPCTWIVETAAHERLFVRPLQEAHRQPWSFDPVFVDSIKESFGMVSAHSRVVDGWLVARDLGNDGREAYSTRLNAGVRVLDKEDCGLVPICSMVPNSKLWRSVWRVLLWRSLLGCGDSNSVNITWSRMRSVCVSVDEVGAPGDIHAQHARPGLACLWAGKPSAQAVRGLRDTFERKLCRETVKAWLSTAADHASTTDDAHQAAALAHMKENGEWLLTRISSSFD